MFDVGWSELLVIGALALIVVGPRELPQLLNKVGRYVGQIKRMAREFQRSLEDAARDSDLGNLKELRDLKKDLGSLDFKQQAARAQSYLKQPVKLDPAAGSKPAQPAQPAATEGEAPAATAAAPDPAAGAGSSGGAAGDGGAPPRATTTADPADDPPGAEAPSPRAPKAKVPEAKVPEAKVSGAKVPGE